MKQGHVIIKGETILVKVDGWHVTMRKGGEKGTRESIIEDKLKASARMVKMLKEGKTIIL